MSRVWIELGGVTYEWSGGFGAQLTSFESTKIKEGEVRFIPIDRALGGGRLFYAYMITEKPGFLINDPVFIDAPSGTKCKVGWSLVDNATSLEQIQELKQEIFG